MDQEEVVVDFLNSSKLKIVDFSQKHQSNEALRDLLETNREVLKCLEDLSNFLNSSFNKNFERALKKYEDCVYINRNKSHENEISLILQKIQNETNDALDFLENLQLIYNSLSIINFNNNNNTNNNNTNNTNNVANSNPLNTEEEGQSATRDSLLGVFRRNSYLNDDLSKVRKRIEENEAKIRELNNEKVMSRNELEKCLETLGNFKTTNSDPAKVESRLALYSHLSLYTHPNFTNF